MHRHPMVEPIAPPRQQQVMPGMPESMPEMMPTPQNLTIPGPNEAEAMVEEMVLEGPPQEEEPQQVAAPPEEPPIEDKPAIDYVQYLLNAERCCEKCQQATDDKA